MEKLDAEVGECSVERFSTVTSKHFSPSTPSLEMNGEGEAGSGEQDGEGGWSGSDEGGRTA